MNELADLKRRITESNLLSAAQLEEAAADNVSGDANALIESLVSKRLLTEFQAEAFSAGLSGPFLLGPYRVEQRVATGRLGDVFKAVHVEFDQPVSLKIFSSVLAKDPEQLARMQREVRVASQLSDPHILRSFQVGRAGGIYFLAFENLDGESLEDRLSRKGRLPYAEACRLVRHAVLGLESLHEAEIVHRDLRPTNMWINEHEQLKLMEFGAARDALAFLDNLEGRGELTQQDSNLGDFLYRAPEAAVDARRADARSDVYSLGCTLYHALAGQPPFVNKNPLRLVQSHAAETPRAVTLFAPEIPTALADFVARLLAKNPDERPAVAEIDWALNPFVDDSSLAAAPAEQVWNPEYLAWLREFNSTGTDIPDVATEIGLTDEATEFFDWLTKQHR